VADTRWRVETCFQTSKNATGLDEHQVRRWDSWYRYTTLVLLAHAILTVIAARERARRGPDDQQRIPVTVNETRRPRTNRHAARSTSACRRAVVRPRTAGT
jgi:SRSO17 transposase